jgi:predicted GNAT superfamily acetyltransferase
MTKPDAVAIRALRTLDECRAVVALQEAVWGRDGEIVPASVLLVSAKSGGILLGAVDADPAPGASNLAGFVWSMPGVRGDGTRTHWSHMLAVLPAYRERRLGEQLKWAQRERAMEQGADLIEWTFDPLQAANAHFNLRVLGAVGATYGVNVYGELAGPLHRGTPTDRLIVEWRIREPHVIRRREARQAVQPPAFHARAAEVLDAPASIATLLEDGWTKAVEVRRGLTDRRILVPVPPNFLAMQQQARERALEWRLGVRDVMVEALAAGYRAVDFFLDRERGGGAYLLARPD